MKKGLAAGKAHSPHAQSSEFFGECLKERQTEGLFCSRA